MPEIIVGEVTRRAEFAEHRVDRRQAEPGHRIDDRDLGMIEDRIGELHGVAGKFGQDGDGRASARTAAAANAQAGMSAASSASPCGTRPASENPPARTQSAPAPMTAIRENPIQGPIQA